ncbi:MAG: von Willebrand factor type A domain-containing protein, partial [Bacteroidales bacterium]|nr:von Willebrand factor type A domain-containing protein [Bacteroidales bacterium]
MKTTLTTILIAFLTSALLSGFDAAKVTGTVTDETGAVIPGVSVSVKGTKRGTSTNINGQYNIYVNKTDKVLVFQFIGMETVEKKIGKHLTINVIMIASEMALEEEVVTGLAGKVPGIRIRGSRIQREMKHKTGGVPYTAQADAAWNPPFNTEGYSTIHENGYKNVGNNPLSTFSIDVDRASYANVRRFLNQGVRPPVDAIRIEEMVNYFKYDYPEPDGEHPFSVYTEVAGCPWNKEHYLMHIGLKGMDIDKTELPPSNLVFLLDVSGSMNSPNKLPLLKSAFTMLVNELRPEDRVAIVVYAGAAGLVLESTPGNQKE